MLLFLFYWVLIMTISQITNGVRIIRNDDASNQVFVVKTVGFSISGCKKIKIVLLLDKNLVEYEVTAKDVFANYRLESGGSGLKNDRRLF